nr:diguanylate cyclase [uncultured Lichenicoccus sp.]
MTAAACRWRKEEEADLASLLAVDHSKIGLFDLAEQLAHVGHWRVDLPDHAVTWSDEVFHIHGVTPDTYVPEIETAIGFYHPDDRDEVRSALASAVRDELPFMFSLRLIRADGELRHVRCRGLTIPGPEGAPIAIIGVFVDVTELQEANFKLRRLAYVDVLTGLANRRQFDETLEREWRRAAREQTALSLIMLDIDRFKSFNDLYGHPAGDDCLGIVAKAVASRLSRPADLAARYGGEEFALILPMTDAAGAETVADAVRAAVAALGIAHTGNSPCGGSVTASLGVSTAYPQSDGSSGAWLGLVADADSMLYEAKRTGRNRAVTSRTLGYRGPALLPDDEEARLAALAIYELAGACRRNDDLDRIARLAAMLTASPVALVSLVGSDELKFVGNHGLEGVEGIGRDISFCAHSILGTEPLVVPDATLDSRFETNPLVTGAMGVRYYAGAPIMSVATGHPLGALCIVDTAPRTETSLSQRALLADLAGMVATLLEDKVTTSLCVSRSAGPTMAIPRPVITRIRDR